MGQVPRATAPGHARRSQLPTYLPAPRPTIVPATDLGGVATLKHRNLYLLADASGDAYPDARGLGLYDLDTRILSCAVLRLDGARLRPLRARALAGRVAALHLASPDAPSVAVARHRWISDGFAERIVVTNDGDHALHGVLELELDFDAADVFQVRGLVRPERGRYLPTLVTPTSVVFAYEGLDGLTRRSRVSLAPATVGPGGPARERPREGSVSVQWTLDVDPGARHEVTWEVRTELLPSGDVPPWDAGRRRDAVAGPAKAAAADAAWGKQVARVTSERGLLDPVIRRSAADLLLLRNDGPEPGEEYVAAGLPWFMTLFGRDSLITAIQLAPYMPEIARGTLQVLAARQATADDPDRDMEPGKILHELRVGELARTGAIPHRPYYGTIDATPLWLILLDEAYRWTGDLQLVRSLWPHALAAIEWIDRHGDPDGDGFVEYARRAPGGLVNQGWKDSEDGIRHRDGTIADPPIALVEVQGYVYDAKSRAAVLADALGDAALGSRLRADAARLRARFDEAFWMPDVGFYAMALDRDKRQVGGIASNAGHCLWSGIVPESRADAVVERLRDPAMDGGWGIRTFAAGQPGYDPLGYHTGSVWPHDNAIIAAGMKRAGFAEDAERVATRIFEAARHQPGFRLPELYGGLDRTPAAAPVPYRVACSPQAWAAAAPLSLLSTLLGMRADAANGVLELDRPQLPDWLGDVSILGLRVGSGSIDLRIHASEGTRTSAEFIRSDGSLDLLIRP